MSLQRRGIVLRANVMAWYSSKKQALQSYANANDNDTRCKGLALMQNHFFSFLSSFFLYIPFSHSRLVSRWRYGRHIAQEECANMTQSKYLHPLHALHTRRRWHRCLAQIGIHTRDQRMFTRLLSFARNLLTIYYYTYVAQHNISYESSFKWILTE